MTLHRASIAGLIGSILWVGLSIVAGVSWPSYDTGGMAAGFAVVAGIGLHLFAIGGFSLSLKTKRALFFWIALVLFGLGTFISVDVVPEALRRLVAPT